MKLNFPLANSMCLAQLPGFSKPYPLLVVVLPSVLDEINRISPISKNHSTNVQTYYFSEAFAIKVEETLDQCSWRLNLAVNPAAYLFLNLDTNNFYINKAARLPVDY